MEDPSEVVYNFAFGSNLAPKKLIQRGITPISNQPAILHGYRLAFNQMGFPPIEPSFANVMPDENASMHGIVYGLSRADFENMRQSEAFNSVDQVTCQTYSGKQIDNVQVFVCLPMNLTPNGEDIPCSARYKALLVDGSKIAGLDPAWQAKLQALPSAPEPSRLGKLLWYYRFDFHAKCSRCQSEGALSLFGINSNGSSSSGLLYLLGGAIASAENLYSDIAAWFCRQITSSWILPNSLYIVPLLPGATLGFLLQGVHSVTSKIFVRQQREA